METKQVGAGQATALLAEWLARSNSIDKAVAKSINARTDIDPEVKAKLLDVLEHVKQSGVSLPHHEAAYSLNELVSAQRALSLVAGHRGGLADTQSSVAGGLKWLTVAAKQGDLSAIHQQVSSASVYELLDQPLRALLKPDRDGGAFRALWTLMLNEHLRLDSDATPADRRAALARELDFHAGDLQGKPLLDAMEGHAFRAMLLLQLDAPEFADRIRGTLEQTAWGREQHLLPVLDEIRRDLAPPFTPETLTLGLGTFLPATTVAELRHQLRERLPETNEISKLQVPAERLRIDQLFVGTVRTLVDLDYGLAAQLTNAYNRLLPDPSEHPEVLVKLLKTFAEA